MVTLVTPRLILAPTPLPVIARRLVSDDFVAEVPVIPEDASQGTSEIRSVHFPPEWPGEALVLLPVWKAQMEADPTFEILGGTMIDRETSTAVGQMSFSVSADRAAVVELGYGVNPAFQGRGYATEMARAMVQWARQQEDIDVIASACLRSNIASVRVLEKVGFTRIGEQTDDEGTWILWEYVD
jgi:ribosomal-protein-alanine N-acetyltransferase